MGKPFDSELGCLASTYSWAMKKNIDPLVNSIFASASLPLLTTGSGGSFTAAHFASLLHQKHVGKIAKAVTPLEIASSSPNLRDAAVLFLSAGGRNTDIIGAFKQVIVREPRRITVMCASPKSPLSVLADTYRYVDLIDFDLPSGKDGFLATNSLLAFSVLLCRLYARAFSTKEDLPDNLQTLVHPTQTAAQFFAELRGRCLPLWQRETLIVLYGTSTHSAALDLESKFTEAALGHVQIADYRNFAHGRHHWLAKRDSTTAVLALVTNDDRHIADKTLRLIPSSIPVTRIDTSLDGVKAGLAALVHALYVVGFAGEARGIDPGRPGVPLFGRQIYNLSTLGTSPAPSHSLLPSEIVSIERKTGMDVDSIVSRGETDFWKGAYRTFVQRLEAVSFSAVVFDYDGTLCDGRDRYTGLGDDIVQRLVQLLKAGVVVGVVTGRGKSVKEVLRDKIERMLWSRVVIGYYNGADNGLLSDDSHPNSAEPPCEALGPISKALRSDSRLVSLAECTFRQMQITVEPKLSAPETVVWDIVQQIVQEALPEGVSVVRSSHSVDVLAPGVSKKILVEKVKEMVAGVESVLVLCIGDRGRWPGNDFALLQEPYSLSVDEVSPDPETCWNLAPAGHRGVQATLDYLRAIQLSDGSFHIAVQKIWRSQ